MFYTQFLFTLSNILMNALKSWLVPVTALTSHVPCLHVSWTKMYSLELRSL